ncbi:MAG: geranylgeranyl reductase family protein [Acidiferrobacteraceae bacterium]
MKETDVLVIGLGPAGGSAARAAAAAGLRALAVDRKRVIGEPVQCAEFVPLPMSYLCQAEGVLRQRIGAMNTFLPSQARAHSDFRGLMVDRARFDRSLAESAASAGAHLSAGTRLVALDVKASRATLLGERGDPEQLSYRLLIAADGPHSPVAHLAGLAPLACVQTRQYTVPLLRDSEDTDVWLSDEFPGGYAWLFPRGTEANLGVGIDRRHQQDLKRPLDRLHRQLAVQGLVGSQILGRTGGDIPVAGLRRELVHSNLLFVGDAGGFTHPISGAGIAAAVISGTRAGEAAAEYCGNGVSRALMDFEEDMRDQFEETLARAVERRRWLDMAWGTAHASEDAVMKRGWIAFPEYFHGAYRAPDRHLFCEDRQ